MQGDGAALDKVSALYPKRRDLRIPYHRIHSLVQSSIDIHGPDPVLILLTVSSELEIRLLVV